MRTLATRFLLFCLPVFVGLGLMEYQLYRTGESWSADRIAERHLVGDDFMYFRFRFGQQFNVDKIATIQALEPDILILGASSVMQIREEIFAPHDDVMYNGGGLIQGVNDLVGFVDLIEDGTVPAPEVIIIGMFPRWFDAEHQGNNWLTTEAIEADATRDFYTRWAIWRELLFEGGYQRLRQLPNANTVVAGYEVAGIGEFTLTNGEGFRPDGSTTYEPHLIQRYLDDPRHVDFHVPPIIDRFKYEHDEWTRTPELSEDHVEEFVQAVANLQAQGIEVHVFATPFTDELVEFVANDSVMAPWWEEWITTLDNELAPLGLKLDAPLSPSSLGADDRYMWDAIHASEVFITQVLLEQVFANLPEDSLLTGIDQAALQAKIDNAVIPLMFELPPGLRE